MPVRNRNHKSEYARRIERGLAKGLTRSEARGHPKPKGQRKRAAGAKLAHPKGKLEQALKSLKTGAHTSLTKAAKEHRVAPERLRRYMHENTKATRKGRRWVIMDKRPRRFPVYSEGHLRDPILVPAEATKASDYMRTVDKFLNSGDRALLASFEGQGVKDVKRVFLPFEVDPNALYQLDAAGELSFPEIYKIVT
jgi:hypothetical protein